MKIYLAGENYKKSILGDKMKIYIAGEHTVKNGSKANWSGINILESYYYARKNSWFPDLWKKMNGPKDSFMLDSGAHTFHQGKAKVDWDQYTEEYAEFVVNYGVELYVEMDIDIVVGLDKVEMLREKLERLTKKKSIPVWHVNRGKQYYLDMCKEYDYIGIGGLTDKKVRKKAARYFPWFLNEAHKQGTKVHGFAFTGTDIKKFNFDSVDSTSWLYGNRGGYLYHFDGSGLKTIQKPEGTMLKSSRDVAFHNFNEWVKFSKYMEGYNYKVE